MRRAIGIAPEGVDAGTCGEGEDEGGERSGEFAEIERTSSASGRHGSDLLGETGVVSLAGQGQRRLGGEDALQLGGDFRVGEMKEIRVLGDETFVEEGGRKGGAIVGFEGAQALEVDSSGRRNFL